MVNGQGFFIHVDKLGIGNTRSKIYLIDLYILSIFAFLKDWRTKNLDTRLLKIFLNKIFVYYICINNPISTLVTTKHAIALLCKAMRSSHTIPAFQKPLESPHFVVVNHATAAEHVNRRNFFRKMKLLPFLIFFLPLREEWPKNAEAKLVRGHIVSGENWKFLARFCFLSMHGKFEYDIIYDASYGEQNIDLYYDTKNQWSRVYGDSADLTTCSEKESVLKVRPIF